MGEELTVSGLQTGYGRVQVVSDVSFTVHAGEMVSMVGRNGVGKTTTLLAVAGLRYGPTAGRVRVGDTDISTAKPYDVVRAGVKLVPEGRRLFREMSVAENLKLGAFIRRRQSKHEIDDDLSRVYDLFPVLARDRERTVLSLSGGQQQMVAIGQALMTRPKFLLLDEPSAGLAPALIDDMYDNFEALARDGIGVLIIDQNIERALTSTSRFYVVEDGRIVAEGSCSSPGVLEQVTRIVLAQAAPAPAPAPAPASGVESRIDDVTTV